MEHDICKPSTLRDNGISRDDDPCCKYKKITYFWIDYILNALEAFQAANACRKTPQREDSATLKSQIGIKQRLSKQAGHPYKLAFC